MSSPHDALFKTTFEIPDIARGELELALPPAVVARLDLATLRVAPGSFIDDELRHAHADILYAVRSRQGAEALVYVLLEHQSSFDALMPLRLLRYMLRVWDRWLRDRPDAKTIPVIVPVVLHHGPERWRAAPALASILDADPELLDAARDFVPLFRFVLDDLRAESADAIADRSLAAFGRLVQLAFWAARSQARLTEAARPMRPLTAAVATDPATRELLGTLFVYLFRAADPDVDADAVRTILLEVAGSEAREVVMNAAEQLIEQGRAEGRAEGVRQALATVLATRGIALSEIGRARFEACADVATLETWFRKALVAASEAEVFANRSDDP